MPKRAGVTTKLSISIDQKDLALLKKRALRVAGGNISAAISQTIHLAEEWDGREALASWLGEGKGEPSAETMDAVRAEWRGTPRTDRRAGRGARPRRTASAEPVHRLRAK